LLGFIILTTVFSSISIANLEALVVFSFFLLVIVIDIEHHLILHTVTLIGAILLGIIGVEKHGLLLTVIGGAAGFIFMYALFLIGVWFGKLLSKRRGTPVEEGLGFGDVTLGSVCGLLLGWPGVSIGLFGGILLGGLYSLVLIVISLIKRDYKPYKTIPYGPFLAIAVFTIWVIRLG
jgi:leader peptidase (prepilin peptidase)/N-methyltransferase